MPASLYGKRILILVPHPDDEVVACGAAIGRAQAEGSTVFALYLTHGCLARETLWSWQRSRYEKYVARRRDEAAAVAYMLQIQAVNWPVLPARHLWRAMDCVYREIQEVMRQYAIDQLWVPAFEGGNPDHDALNAIGSVLKNSVSVLEFAEYNFLGEKAQSHMFPDMNGTEQVFQLTDAEKTQKREALQLYKSERQNLNYVKMERECFRPLASYDYSRMPHEGKLWYTRFQWVPFQHPRVDFTQPEEVAEKIITFVTKCKNGVTRRSRGSI